MSLEQANPVGRDDGEFPIISMASEKGLATFFSEPESLPRIASLSRIEMSDGAWVERAEARRDEMWRDPQRFREHAQLIINLAYDQDQLIENGRRDPLTKLLNKEAWTQQLIRSIENSGRTGSRVAVVLFDLDAFKEVNDTLGHQAGDGVLLKVAQALMGVRNGRLLAGRLGGDEFGLILEFSPDDVVDASGPKRRGKRPELTPSERVDAAVTRVIESCVSGINEELSGLGIARLRIAAGASIHEPGMTFTEMLVTADGNVRVAKQEGIDVHFESLSPEQITAYLEGWEMIRQSGVYLDERLLPMPSNLRNRSQ